MPSFHYEASTKAGRKVKAAADAVDETALREQLRAEGLIPISIAKVLKREGLKPQRVSQKDLLLFTQELANLLEAGLPVDRALYILSEHIDRRALRETVRQVYSDIQKGQSLSQSLGNHKVFPTLYVSMVKAGEMGGILEVTLKRLSEFLETSQAFKEEITTALIYPALLTFVGGVSILVLMLYVIPKFAAIFADMGQAMPLPTQILMDISNFMTSYWWAMLIALAGSGLLLKAYADTAEGRLYIDDLKTRLPVVRDLHMKIVIARFSRTLGTLLQSGVPILGAIGVSREVLGNEAVSARLRALEDGVRKGRGVAQPLRECGVFPPIVSQMLAVGEEAGRLDESFLNVAARFEAEGSRLLKRLVGLIEPVMILVMGVIVGFIVISMLMAVFSINEIPY